jgi:branched-chain amino acid transport system substrate-binding protein
MRKLLMKAGVPLVAGGLVLSGLGGAAFAGAATRTHASIKTYTIAYEGPLSGGNQALGLNMIYAVELAIAQWNAKKGDPFRLTAVQKLDDQGDPTISPTEAHIAVSDSKTVAVVGPAFSGATEAAQAVYGPAHMPLVSPSATNPVITQSYNPDHNFFRVVADDSVQGPADANYAVTKLKTKSIYVVNDASTYGSGLASAFATQATHDGATVTTNTADGTTGCSAGTGSPTEYPPLASIIATAKPALVFYGGYYCDFALFTAALRTAGYTGKLMSGDGSDDPHYVSETSPSSDANGAYLTCACAAVGTTAADKAFTAGFKKYSKGVAPGTYSPESYDATNTLIQAMLALYKAHKPITRAQIVAELKKITYKGLTKTIHFLPTGNIAGTAIYVNQVQKGKIVQLGLE